MENTFRELGKMKIYPDLKQFLNLSKKYNIIPVCREIVGDIETPVSAFMKIKSGVYNFLLESAEQGEKTGRYSFIGTNPELIIKGEKEEVKIYNNKTGEERVIKSKKPIKIIEKYLKSFRSPDLNYLPGFTGGFIGFISYDFVRTIEELPSFSDDDLKTPYFMFMFSKQIIVFDHFKRKILLINNISVDGKDSAKKSYKKGIEELSEFKEKLEKPLYIVEPLKRKKKEEPFRSNFSKNDFIKSVEKIKKYIKEGDIIQCVLSQRWEKSVNVEPLNVYRSLRMINPSPYMFFLQMEDINLIGSSPEILVKLEGKKAVVRPIAGTRKRGRDEKEEKELEKELADDEKEKAEHIMLVDLGRNDLGKVCIPGSVKVTELMKIEKYSHVMHLVSNVEGILKKNKSPVDLLSATFPAGTVTGAPKIRAMEIIEELEPKKRGPYAGAVGYFSLIGDMDFCITIRTIVINHGKIYIQAGAGIVADSIPEKEYKETMNKAKGPMEAYKISGEII